MSFYLMHRGWMDNELFQDTKYGERDAWCYLIEHAGYEPSKLRHNFKMIEVGRGQVPTSFRKLADKWKWSVNRVRRFLDLLENERMISKKTDTGFLIITVCNYDSYQVLAKKADTLSYTPPDTGSDTRSDTNIKNIKKLKKEYTSEFLEFYSVHPGRHGSKADAFKSYETAREHVGHATLINSAKKYYEFVKASHAEQRHICHAATWLNQKRWESEYALQAIVKTIGDKDRAARKGARVLL